MTKLRAYVLDVVQKDILPLNVKRAAQHGAKNALTVEP
jgi:hypothetical protein